MKLQLCDLWVWDLKVLLPLVACRDCHLGKEACHPIKIVDAHLEPGVFDELFEATCKECKRGKIQVMTGASWEQGGTRQQMLVTKPS